MGLLDLSGADTKGFDAIPANTYNAEVYEVTLTKTKGGENAKLPEGTDMWNVQFRITDEEYENRRVFRKYIIAPDKVAGKKYDKKAMFDGMLVRFLMAIGYDEEELTSGSYEPDFDDMKGRECRVVVSVRQYDGEDVNDVKGVKPPDENSAGDGLL